MLTTSAAEAAECLKQGHVLAYPTEAVWGLGCDPFNQDAFLEILRLKQRPIEKGVILLAAQISQVEHLLEMLSPDMQQKVVESWRSRSPAERATTWLLPADDNIPSWIKGNSTQVAVRVTTHPLCIALCNAFHGCIVSTSANPAGDQPASSLQQATQYFSNQVDYLNGDLGLSQQACRIIDAQSGEVIRA